MRSAALAMLAVRLGAAQAAQSHRTTQSSGVMARLRGVSAVSECIAWASSARGTILRNEDAGQTWRPRPVPGTSTRDFRDIDAVDAQTRLDR